MLLAGTARAIASRRIRTPGVLVAASDGERFVTGGDDGRVAVTGADGSTKTLAEAKGAWIDSLALSAGGAFAYATGKRVIARDDKGREKTPRGALRRARPRLRAQGLSSGDQPLQRRDASGFPTSRPSPKSWNGRARISTSPGRRDARFVVTSMQENALHGWRLSPTRAICA